ncbi:HlyD family efflux transporter periplasmic adaptor subunit [Azospirillum sp. SYSU D00513]|uniref:HlyD family secretion protein n=1 Tax=Azospirillum sp. SYSU D00513 TaxID=2812561 RepID=UPI001A96EF8F|nr:HlyD family efflux transporter periplasmic adaptor subunit [Azospirillum sp. SYSU D00513]
MFWNRRSVRIAVGLLLLLCGILALLPGLTGYTSLDGTVNARFATLSTPIEGMVGNTPPKVGTPVAKDGFLLSVRNERVDRSTLVQLTAELNTTRDRLQALTNQEAEMRRLQVDLRERLEAYRQATMLVLEQEIAVQRQRIGINEARTTETRGELMRKQRLQTGGLVPESEIERTLAAQLVASGEADLAREELERLERQLEAVRQGVFVGDGRNDVPYSRQRIDELAIALMDIEARRKEQRAHLDKLEKLIAHEEERLLGLEAVEMRMPFDGVVWRNNVVSGSNTVVGTELMRLLDCSDLFVDILVAEVDYDEIFPGRPAEIRLLGRGEALTGAVQSVRGSAADVEEMTLAASPPQSKGRDARIRVRLDPSPLSTDYENFCQIGRTAQVRFETRSLPLERWIRSLWFSIS